MSKPFVRSLLFTPPPPSSLYVHLPFCVQKCAYCAFPVVVSQNPQHHRRYVDNLIREIDSFFVARRDAEKLPLDTLYFGGGTPSLISTELLSNIFSTLHRHLSISSNAEITVEMDPATFTREKAAQFAQLGVNRASVGAQSFEDNILSACRRVHRKKDISLAVDHLRAANISNVSLDLISALPNQSMQSWKSSLDEAIQLEPDHISAYDLTLEPDTHFANKYSSGIHPLPNEHIAADMMRLTAEKLQNAGFEHYEVSNYAKRTHPSRSRHNMAYWTSRPFYAFGLGATSLVDGFRFARPRRLSDYYAYVDQLDSFLSASSEEHLLATLYPHIDRQSEVERLEDYLINAFRLLDRGVIFQDVEEVFGDTVRNRLEHAIDRNRHFEEEGLLHAAYDSDRLQSVRLTEQGALVENSVLSDIMQCAVWDYH